MNNFASLKYASKKLCVVNFFVTGIYNNWRDCLGILGYSSLKANAFVRSVTTLSEALGLIW